MIKDSAEAVERMEVFLLGSRDKDRCKLEDLKKELAKLQEQIDYFNRKEKLQNQIIALTFVRKRKRQELVEQLSAWASAEEVNAVIAELREYGIIAWDLRAPTVLGFSDRFYHYPNDAVYH